MKSQKKQVLTCFLMILMLTNYITPLDFMIIQSSNKSERIMKIMSNGFFGDLLKNMLKGVDDVIQNAINSLRSAGIEILIKTGEEITRAIEQIKNAYKDQLDYTLDKLSKEAKKAFDSLNSMVERFERVVIDEMDEIMSEAQQLANSLPFASHQPQLRKKEPSYVIIGDTKDFTLIKFTGNFPNSAKVGFEPSLELGDSKFYIVNTTTQGLTFRLPHSVFKSIDPLKYSYLTIKLRVPWDDGWIFSHKTEYSYAVGIGSLPNIAGNGITEYVSKSTERIEQAKESPNFHYDGNAFYPEPWHDCFQDIYPDRGWTIDVTKYPILQVGHNHGYHKQEIISVSPDKIVTKVGLYCKTGHDMGIVDISVRFTQYRDNPVINKRTENFSLNWIDKILAEPKDQETISKVEFIDYKGGHDVFASPSLENDIIKISSQGDGKWKMWAQPPKDL
jgi:hypothetical protein